MLIDTSHKKTVFANSFADIFLHLGMMADQTQPEYDLHLIKETRIQNGLAEVLIGDDWIETKITMEELEKILPKI